MRPATGRRRPPPGHARPDASHAPAAARTRARNHANAHARRAGARIAVRLVVQQDPRDRLYRRGVSALADGELLEVLVGARAPGVARTTIRPAVATPACTTSRAPVASPALVTSAAPPRMPAPGCEPALTSRPSLAELARASPHELASAGLGRAGAARLAAAFELGRRAVESAQHRTFVRTPHDVLALLGPRVAGLQQELFFAIGLDVRHRVLEIVEVARGTVTDVAVHPREVFRPLVRIAAAGAVLAHNHPSGDPLPSADDIELTRRLCAVGKIVGIPVLDHVVIGGNEMRSIAECMGDL